MPETDHDYFERRAREEREASTRAASQESRAAHGELARRYAALAATLDDAGDQVGDEEHRAIIARISIAAERGAAADAQSASADG